MAMTGRSAPRRSARRSGDPVPPPDRGWHNWAGNQHATASGVAHPASSAELAEIVRAARATGGTVRAVGTGHSFTAAAHTDGVRVEMDRMAGLVSVDRAAREVTVGAGMPLRVLNQVLAANGLALPNLGDIDAQTVAGATATGTHGTGAAFGCLSTFLTAVELVTGTGEVIRADQAGEADLLAAARVSLGALGVVTEATVRCVDAFTLRATERPEPLAAVLAAVDERVHENDHFEFYWFPYTDRVQTKTNNRVPDNDRPLPAWRGWLDDEFLSNTVFEGACRIGRAVPRSVPMITGISARALSPRQYTARSDQVFCTPRRVRFIEMEYSLPRAALAEAFAGLRTVIDSLPFPVVFPVEVRFTGPDDVWLSHGYGRDNAYIAVHQYVGMPYEPYFREFEKLATALGGRPHWGKMHYRDAASLRPAYPRFDDFLAVRDRLDPDRVFRNSYTDSVLG